MVLSKEVLMKDINTMQGMTALAAHVQQAKTLEHVKPVKRVCAYAVLAMLSGYTVQLMNSAGDIRACRQLTVVILFVCERLGSMGISLSGQRRCR
jgi:hypothetical protein